MRERTEFESSDAIFATLKRVLHKQGLGYAELAERLGMSESGVKKMFAQRNCSLRRLSAIAEAIGVPLSEVVALSERPPIRRVELSLEQQQWLLAHPDAFACYWKLAVELWTPRRFADHFGLSRAELWTMLSALDDIGLVRVETGDRVVVLHGDLVRWSDRGPLMAQLNATWSAALLDDVFEREGEDGTLFRMSFLEMRPETAKELQDALEGLADEFARRARYEKATTAERDLVVRRLLLAYVSGGFVEGVGEG